MELVLVTNAALNAYVPGSIFLNRELKALWGRLPEKKREEMIDTKLLRGDGR